MASIPQVIERWETLLHGGPGRQLNGCNVFGEGDTLYSYGRHFPLCEYLRPNRRRARALYLLNGDRSSVSTTRHQNETRAVVERAAREHGADTIIVPFSALEAAGIDRSSIVPLEVRPDEWKVVDRAEPFERVPLWRRPNGDGTAQLSGAVVLGPDGLYHWQDRVHRLGDSLFVADVPGTRTVSRPVSVADVVAAAVRSINARRHDRTRFLDVVETLDNVDTERPIVETVPVRRRHRFVSSFDINEPAPLYFLAQLPATSRARTVASAIQDLAPPAVHAAIARGRHVDRQGDIFAIETSLADSDMAGWPRARLTQWTRNARPLPHEPGYVAPLTADERRRLIRRARALWRRRWAQGPMQVPAPLTPRGTRAKTRADIENAARGLEKQRAHARRTIIGPAPKVMPGYPANPAIRYSAERAREAFERARRHYRATLQTRPMLRDRYRHGPSIQGGEYARQLWRDCYRDAYLELRPAARPERQDRARRQTRELLSIHGTAHTATEVARGPGGAVYIRGTMRHEPSIEPGRNGDRDHINRRLRDGVWYLAVRNTVPRQRVDRRAR